MPDEAKVIINYYKLWAQDYNVVSLDTIREIEEGKRTVNY